MNPNRRGAFPGNPWTGALSCGLLLSLPIAGLAANSPPALPVIAIAQLEARKIDTMDVSTLSDALADQLLKTKQVRVMERSQMDAILKEQGFQQSGTCDAQECAVQIGKILGIERILVGSVAGFGRATTISLRMVDVQTGELLSTASRTWKGEFEDLLTDIVPQMARELAGPRHLGPAMDPVPSRPERPRLSARTSPPSAPERDSSPELPFGVYAIAAIFALGTIVALQVYSPTD